MQFTEVYEVQDLVAFCRRSRFQHGSFHDRHDSEMDRAWHHSPSEEWVDNPLLRERKLEQLIKDMELEEASSSEVAAVFGETFNDQEETKLASTTTTIDGTTTFSHYNRSDSNTQNPRMDAASMFPYYNRSSNKNDSMEKDADEAEDSRNVFKKSTNKMRAWEDEDEDKDVSFLRPSDGNVKAMQTTLGDATASSLETKTNLTFASSDLTKTTTTSTTTSTTTTTMTTTTATTTRTTKEVSSSDQADESPRKVHAFPSVVEFIREEVKSPPLYEKSMLTQVLLARPGEFKSMLALRVPDAMMLTLKMYLPNTDFMSIELYETSTVEETIQAVLLAHEREHRTPFLYYGHAECYELRLHDAGGYPDDDFPALDRSRKIKNFGDAGGHEYCLCERPDACPPVSTEAFSSTKFHSQTTTAATTSTANATATTLPTGTGEETGTATEAATATLSALPVTFEASSPLFVLSKDDCSPVSAVSMETMKKSHTNVQELKFIKIHMPNDDYTVVAVDEHTTGQDLLPTLNKKHRLQIFKDEYVLRVNKSDRERLGLPSDNIDLHTKLRPLGLMEVFLEPKQYADAPKIPAKAPHIEVKALVRDASIRPALETFMFNDVTAAMYKEWEVIKKNKYGKRQTRVMGMDGEKIYNEKIAELAVSSRTATKHAERLISTVVGVSFLPNPCEFRIVYSEAEVISLDYTAKTPFECAEIVAKLKYLMSRRG